MSLSNNFPTVSPTLNLNFAAAGRLDSRVTFTRSSTATYTNQIGLIQSAAVNEPRFDYDPSTLAARGLLIEEQRTNLVTYSERFDNAAWTKNFITVTANAIAAPDGTVTADKIAANTTTGIDHSVDQTVATSTSTSTFSVYAKAAEYNRIAIGRTGTTSIAKVFELTGAGAAYDIGSTSWTGWTSATAGNFSITALADGWYRISITVPATSVGRNDIYIINNGGNERSFAAAIGSGVYIWGAQLEAGSFATSYIPTVAASVTRSADVASVNTLSPWWNNVEGTLFADYTASSSSFVAMLYTDASNNMVMIGGTSGAAFDVNNAGVVQATLGARVLSAKIAARFKANDFAVCLNGGAVATDTSGTVPSITDRLALGYFPGVGLQINGYLRRVTFYPRTLTSAELQAITA